MRYLVSLILVCTLSYLPAQKLVLPGDFPDPSVTKSGDKFWATATTSNWAPIFPLLESSDLVHWELRGHVFTEPPSWADYYFWAPEISYDKGKYYVYYSAHKRGGNLCLAVASADKPEGPYKDHGPLMCQEVGSIDAWPMRDEQGKLYLIWKEDGNSVKMPTPIWAMEMNEARTELLGEKKELFRNDEPWESNLVEGVSMIRHGDYLYAFYAGAGCCGRGCSYGIGVARARKLLGPWEKFEGNPLTATSDDWKCPGHGTPAVLDGKYYFLYHAYDQESSVYAGRQGVLSEFTFTPDGWIEFVNGAEGTKQLQSQSKEVFDGDKIGAEWQWSVFQKPSYQLKNGRLALQANAEKAGAFLARKTTTEDYEADVTVYPGSSTAEGGLALIGDEKNFVSVSVTRRHIIVRKVEADRETVIEQRSIPRADSIHLRATVAAGKDINFSFSTDGKKYAPLHTNKIDGSFLPPWDRAVRVGIFSKGARKDIMMFDDFLLKSR